MPSDQSAMTVQAPAKVNLHLGVGDRRPDGFHELVSVFHAVGLYDIVRAEPAATPSLSVGGDHAAGVPADERNLAWRAAALLASASGIDSCVHLRLGKHIPVAGGMAGGSADAAGALLACSALWGVTADLPALAAELGSDVPFALLGGTALGTGRGEVLQPLPTVRPLHWVFAFSEAGISAGDAYRELDRLRSAGTAPEPIGSPEPLIAALVTGDLPTTAAALANDLEAAAISLQPSLQDTLDTGTHAGALRGIVSGSGPTCAFLCADEPSAQRVAAALRAGGRRAAVATGPGHGAALL